MARGLISEEINTSENAEQLRDTVSEDTSEVTYDIVPPNGSETCTISTILNTQITTSLATNNTEETLDASATGNKFCVDHSKRGTSKCRKCKKEIIKGLLRIGKYAAFKGKIIIQYFHPNWVFKTFEKARLKSSILTNLNDLDGIENITDDERNHIGKLIEEGNQSRTNSVIKVQRHNAKSW